jgi:hypothetical protein
MTYVVDQPGDALKRSPQQGETQMKKSVVTVALAATMTLFTVACREEATEARPEATTTEVAGVGSTADASPVNAQTWIDDVTIGHELGADGAIVTTSGGDDFAAGQAVHVAMTVNDAPQNSSVKLVWYGPNETKINEETKTITPGQQKLNFTANSTGWAKGDYRAEVWIADEKVNTQQFQIVDPAGAGK